MKKYLNSGNTRNFFYIKFKKKFKFKIKNNSHEKGIDFIFIIDRVLNQIRVKTKLGVY